MPRTPGSLGRRDPELQEAYDGWARELLDVLRADPWEWHGRTVTTPAGHLATDDGGLTRWERAAQRSLYWCLGHAASSGLKTRPDWSLQVAWGPPVAVTLAGQLGDRARLLSARVTPKAAGQRSVLIRGRGSYIARPTSSGARPGDGWRPHQP